MPYADKTRQREFQRKWKQKRRAKYIQLFGGVCKECGSKDSLEFDHTDRTTKMAHRIWTWSEEKIKTELSKCQLLCHACHRAKSNIEISVQREHGEYQMYDRGCRCRKCKDAHAAQMRIYRSTKGRSDGNWHTSRA